MADLIHHFGWRWIGTIAADDDYGKYGVKAFKESVENLYTCIAFSETIPKIYNREKIKTVVNIVKDNNATVIVVYSSDIDFHPLVEELMISNVSGITWIASEAWVTSALIARPEYFPLLGGAIGFGIRRGEIPGLREFLLEVDPNKDSNDMTIEFWQSAFNCTWPGMNISYNTDNRKNVTGHENVVNFYSDTLCTGKEKLEDLDNTYLDVSELRITYNVYKAVYAVAYGLDQLRMCETENGPFISGPKCATIDEFEPWQVCINLGIMIPDPTYSKCFCTVQKNSPVFFQPVLTQCHKKNNLFSFTEDGKKGGDTKTSLWGPNANSIPFLHMS